MNLIEESKRLASLLEASMIESQKQLDSVFEKLEAEREVAKEANKQGDRSENAEWQIAIDNIGRLSSTAARLQGKIDTYKSFSSGYVPCGIVSLGSTVKIYDHAVGEELVILIVPKGLGNAKIGSVAVGTAVSNALMGKSAGTVVTVRAPAGDYTLTLKEVY